MQLTDVETRINPVTGEGGNFTIIRYTTITTYITKIYYKSFGK